MKRILALLIALCLIATVPLTTSATSNTDDSVIYLDDGSYIVVTVSSFDTRASGTKSGSKSYNCYTPQDELEWKAVLSGTFTYNGTSATCTSSSCNITVYDTSWYEVSKTATRSGNTAYATFTMGRKVLGITVSKREYSLTLSCDANGILS